VLSIFTVVSVVKILSSVFGRCAEKWNVGFVNGEESLITFGGLIYRFNDKKRAG